VAINK